MAEHKAVQPTRLLPFRMNRAPQFKSGLCYSVAQATWKTTVEDLLGDRVCLTLRPEVLEADIAVAESDNDARQEYKAMLEARLQFERDMHTPTDNNDVLWYKKELEDIQRLRTFNTNNGYRVTIDPAAEALLSISKHFTLCGDKREWRAITVSPPGHVAIVLWNVWRHTAELFDSSGTAATSMDIAVLDAVRTLLPPEVHIFAVNNQDLQQEDVNCQTWIWYYVYHRVALGERASVLIHRLQALTPKQRFAEINRFWHFLLRVQERHGNSPQQPVGAFTTFKLYGTRPFRRRSTRRVPNA